MGKNIVRCDGATNMWKRKVQKLWQKIF